MLCACALEKFNKYKTKQKKICNNGYRTIVKLQFSSAKIESKNANMRKMSRNKVVWRFAYNIFCCCVTVSYSNLLIRPKVNAIVIVTLTITTITVCECMHFAFCIWPFVFFALKSLQFYVFSVFTRSLYMQNSTILNFWSSWFFVSIIIIGNEYQIHLLRAKNTNIGIQKLNLIKFYNRTTGKINKFFSGCISTVDTPI